MSVTIRGTTLKCKKHSRYTAAFPPRNCEPCWELYELDRLSMGIDQDLDDLMQGIYRFAKENG
jgi:hypothetical protein